MDPFEAEHRNHQLVYRTALGLQSVHTLLKGLLVEHVEAGLLPVGGALSRQEVTNGLRRMFASKSDLLGHVTSLEEVCDLMFTIFDREQSGRLSAHSLRVALIALSSDQPQLKFNGLLNTLRNQSIERSALRGLLRDVNQILVLVKQEQNVYGSVEDAVTSCFDGVSTPAVSRGHVLLWLQSEPRLLLWLPALHRLSITENVLHRVRCYTCKKNNITGLRFRCQKCLNVHVCLSCFLTGRQRKKHKTYHPLLEFHTQPTWRETLSSIASSTRYNLLPRRHPPPDGRRSQLVGAEPKDTLGRAPPPSESASLGSADSAPSQPSHHVPALLSDVRALQRDRSLLEAELQALRLSVQTEQRMLGSRYSEMEVSMETLRRENVLLSQVLNEMKERETTSPTVLLDRLEESPEEAELQEQLSSESEDDWMSDDEEELQKTVERLKSEMKTDGWTPSGVHGSALMASCGQLSVVVGLLVTALIQNGCKTLLK